MVFTGSQGRSIEVAIEGDASSLRSAIDGARSGLMNLRGAAKAAGLGLAALSAGGIAKSIQSSAELETRLAEVTTLMGEGEDAAEIYGDTVARLSSEFALHGGQVEATEALYQTLSAGIADAGDETAFLETAMRNATAGLTDTETSVDILSTVVNAYGLEASEAARVSDVLFQTVRSGKTKMGELASTLGRAVPVAAEMGVEIEELGAAVATLTAQGQSTDEAVTAVNRTLTSLLKPSSEAADVIERMGYESGRALVEQEGLAGSLDVLQAHAESSSDELTDVFGNVRALRAVLPLANEASEDFAENLDDMAESAGATDEAFETMADTSEFRFRQALNRLRSSMTRTGETYLPLVSDMLDGTNDLLEGFNELQEASDGAAGSIVALGGVVGGVGLLFGGFAGVVAGAGAAAFMAWSTNMWGMRDATQRSVADIQDSLGRLTNTTGDEIGEQLDLWDRWGIRIANVVDLISTQFAMAVDGIVSGTEIITTGIGEVIGQVKALKEGDFARAREIGQGSREQMWGAAADFVERTRERQGALSLRSDFRSEAREQDDPSLLPRRGRGEDTPGVSGAAGGVLPEDLMNEFRREQDRTRGELGGYLEDIRDENRRTADATTATLGGGPCDLTEHLLDPLERAQRPAETEDAGIAAGTGGWTAPTGGDTRDPGSTGARFESGPTGSGSGSQSTRVSTGAMPGDTIEERGRQRELLAGSNITVENTLEVDGKELTKEQRRASKKYFKGVRVTE